MQNSEFEHILTNIINDYFIEQMVVAYDGLTQIDETKRKTSINQLTFIALFGKPTFHILHKCICQQIELGIIDNEMLVELKQCLLSN